MIVRWYLALVLAGVVAIASACGGGSGSSAPQTAAAPPAAAPAPAPTPAPQITNLPVGVPPLWVEALQRAAGGPDPNSPADCFRLAELGQDARLTRRCLDFQRMVQSGATPRSTNDVVAYVSEAVPALQQMWVEMFRSVGRPLEPPTVDYYGVGRVTQAALRARSDCPLVLENAFYCTTSGRIFYDAIFLAKIAAGVQLELGTSGRYAVISVVAHELGHAARFRANGTLAKGPGEELLADCFSGAVMKAYSDKEAGQSQAARLLHATAPLAEGQMGLYVAQKDVPPDGVHPEDVIRQAAYRAGFNRGLIACDPDTFR